jgi:hypothetical protein
MAKGLTLAAAVLLLVASRADAWSSKEHVLLTRIAAARLVADPATPAAMKDWLRAAVPNLPTMDGEREYLVHARVGVFPRGVDGIPFWATVPDLNALADSGGGDRARKVEPFGVPERLLHFIDVELFMPDEARRRYAPDLSNKPALADIPKDPADPRFARAGMLPFRVEQCYGKLVESIRAGRLTDAPGQFPRDEHAAKWAGFLAHYVEDNTQPHHATADYKSATYFAANPRGAPNVHADMEYRLVDDDYADYPELRRAFWEAFAKAVGSARDPVGTDGDLFRSTLEVSLASYDALPLIGEAAVAAYGAAGGGRPSDFNAEAFYTHRGRVRGEEVSLLEMKARQMAWAERRVETLWLRAWKEATATAPAPQAPVRPQAGN